MVLLETDLGPGVCFPEGTFVSGCCITETSRIEIKKNEPTLGVKIASFCNTHHICI